jgi:hypothetical protein
LLRKPIPANFAVPDLFPAGLLREPAQRREHGCASNQGYQVPALHSITSSARASSAGETVMRDQNIA